VKFLLDHDVPDEVAQLLRHWKHDAQRLRELLPIRTPDDGLFRFAQQEGRIIITCNRNHFLKLAREAAMGEHLFPGLIILVRRRSRQAECAHILSLLRRAGEEGLRGNINLA
jgi:predicted nuclease of predicted toxin-antitoxin system